MEIKKIYVIQSLDDPTQYWRPSIQGWRPIPEAMIGENTTSEEVLELLAKGVSVKVVLFTPESELEFNPPAEVLDSMILEEREIR
jgi:hypothetical protein